MKSKHLPVAVIIAVIAVIIIVSQKKDDKIEKFAEFQEKVSMNEAVQTDSAATEWELPLPEKAHERIIKGLQLSDSSMTVMPTVSYNGSEIPLLDYFETATSSPDSSNYAEYNYRMGLIYLVPMYEIPADTETAMVCFGKAASQIPEAGTARDHIKNKM